MDAQDALPGLDSGFHRGFVLANTALTPPPRVPEICLHLANDAHALWHLTQQQLAQIGLPPPFWAFAWAGGQALARHVLDHPETVGGKRVLDFASGSGLVAIAAAKAGAIEVTACDVDPLALPAIVLNAERNGAEIIPVVIDLIGSDAGWDVVLAGDVFYDKTLAGRLVPWLAALRQRGAEVLVGDPGRSYLPTDRLLALADYSVPVTRALEDGDVKHTTVWRFA